MFCARTTKHWAETSNEKKRNDVYFRCQDDRLPQYEIAARRFVSFMGNHRSVTGPGNQSGKGARLGTKKTTQTRVVKTHRQTLHGVWFQKIRSRAPLEKSGSGLMQHPRWQHDASLVTSCRQWFARAFEATSTKETCGLLLSNLPTMSKHWTLHWEWCGILR